MSGSSWMTEDSCDNVPAGTSSSSAGWCWLKCGKVVTLLWSRMSSRCWTLNVALAFNIDSVVITPCSRVTSRRPLLAREFFRENGVHALIPFQPFGVTLYWYFQIMTCMTVIERWRRSTCVSATEWKQHAVHESNPSLTLSISLLRWVTIETQATRANVDGRPTWRDVKLRWPDSWKYSTEWRIFLKFKSVCI